MKILLYMLHPRIYTSVPKGNRALTQSCFYIVQNQRTSLNLTDANKRKPSFSTA